MAYQQSCDVRDCGTFKLMTTVTLWIKHLECKTVRPDRMYLKWHKSCRRGKLYQSHRFELSNRSLGWKLKQSEQMVVAWTQKERDLTQVYSYSETIWISFYDDFPNHTLMSNNPGLVMDTIYHRKKIVFQRLHWHGEYLRGEYLLKVNTHHVSLAFEILVFKLIKFKHVGFHWYFIDGE